MKNYKLERLYMKFDNIEYIVFRLKHYLYKDQWRDRCKVYQKKYNNSK